MHLRNIFYKLKKGLDGRIGLEWIGGRQEKNMETDSGGWLLIYNLWFSPEKNCNSGSFFCRNLEKWDFAEWFDPLNTWLTTSTPSDKHIFVDVHIDIQVNAGSSKCWLRRDLWARTSALSLLSWLNFKKLRKCSAPCWLFQDMPERVRLFKFMLWEFQHRSLNLSSVFHTEHTLVTVGNLLMNQKRPVWRKYLIPSCANVFAPVGGSVSIHQLALWAVISQSHFYIETILPPGVENIIIKKISSHCSPPRA